MDWAILLIVVRANNDANRSAIKYLIELPFVFL